MALGHIRMESLSSVVRDQILVLHGSFLLGFVLAVVVAAAAIFKMVTISTWVESCRDSMTFSKPSSCITIEKFNCNSCTFNTFMSSEPPTLANSQRLISEQK